MMSDDETRGPWDEAVDRIHHKRPAVPVPGATGAERADLDALRGRPPGPGVHVMRPVSLPEGFVPPSAAVGVPGATGDDMTARYAGSKLVDASEIGDGEWGLVYRKPMFRPPGTPRALPLGPTMRLRVENGRPTVTPSVHYDPDGPWEWHGWLRDGVWEKA